MDIKNSQDDPGVPPSDPVTGAIVEAARRHVVAAIKAIEREEMSLAAERRKSLDEFLRLFQALHMRLDGMALGSSSMQRVSASRI
jgi:hypothetical protein